MSILAIGTVALDTIETPFGRRENVLGGSATYITLAARYFADPVQLVAVVGQDFPQEYLDLLHKSGVDTTGLEVDADGLTFAWEGKYHFDLNQRDTLDTRLNVLETFNPVIPEAYRNARVLCLGNLAPAIQTSVLEQMERPELVVLDTMNFWIEQTPDDLRETLKRVDVLVINDSEARELANEPNLVKAARKVRAMGPRILIIKKGEHGALLFFEDKMFSAPAYPLEDVNDPTGAGDAFMGGFAGCLVHHGLETEDDFRRAVIHGCAIASFAVERFGPERLVDLTEDEIRERVEAFRDLSLIPV